MFETGALFDLSADSLAADEIATGIAIGVGCCCPGTARHSATDWAPVGIRLSRKFRLNATRQQAVYNRPRFGQPAFITIAIGPEAYQELIVDIESIRIAIRLDIISREAAASQVPTTL
jgi:hypothetical protein